MKNIKKYIAFVISVVLIFCAVGCSDKTKDENPLNTLENGKLTMATYADFPPYEFYDENKIIGIDAEIAGLIAEKLGLELEIIDIEFDSIVPAIQSGKYDIGMAALTVSSDRLRKVNFTSFYATGKLVIVLPENSTIKSLDDLDKKSVGVMENTPGDIYATKDLGEEYITRYPNSALAVKGLKGGEVDCLILDQKPAQTYAEENTELSILKTAYANEEYAICIAKENTVLLEKVDAALKELEADGSIQKIINKYIPSK